MRGPAVEDCGGADGAVGALLGVDSGTVVAVATPEEPVAEVCEPVADVCGPVGADTAVESGIECGARFDVGNVGPAVTETSRAAVPPIEVAQPANRVVARTADNSADFRELIIFIPISRLSGPEAPLPGSARVPIQAAPLRELRHGRRPAGSGPAHFSCPHRVADHFLATGGA